MRVAVEVLHTTQQERLAVLQTNRTGVEDRVSSVLPVLGRQNRIGLVPAEQNLEKSVSNLLAHHDPIAAHW